MIKPSKEKLVFEPIEVPKDKTIGGIIVKDEYHARDGNNVNPKLGKLVAFGPGVNGYIIGKRYYYNPYDMFVIRHIEEDDKEYEIVALAGMLCGIDK